MNLFALFPRVEVYMIHGRPIDMLEKSLADGETTEVEYLARMVIILECGTVTFTTQWLRPYLGNNNNNNTLYLYFTFYTRNAAYVVLQ